MTLVEMLDIALVIRSVSPRAVKKAGNDEINILSMLSGVACGVGELSAINAIGTIKEDYLG